MSGIGGWIVGEHTSETTYSDEKNKKVSSKLYSLPVLNGRPVCLYLFSITNHSF